MRKVQILGSGCSKCQTLYENARLAATRSGEEWEVLKITEIVEILNFQAMGLPALAIDGQVQSCGRVLTPEEIETLLRK